MGYPIPIANSLESKSEMLTREIGELQRRGQTTVAPYVCTQPSFWFHAKGAGGVNRSLLTVKPQPLSRFDPRRLVLAHLGVIS